MESKKVLEGGQLIWNTNKKAPEGKRVLTAYVFEDKQGVQSMVYIEDDQAETKHSKEISKVYLGKKTKCDKFGFLKYDGRKKGGRMNRVLAWAEIPEETKSIFSFEIN